MGTLRKTSGKEATTNILEILEAQHKEVDALLEKLEEGEGDRMALLTELADNLAAHASCEEKVFYPFVMAKDTEEILQESVEEHLSIKRVLADMITMKLDDDGFDAKLSVLKEQVSHHAHEEEEDKLFPKVRNLFTAEELVGVGNQYLAMFEDLLPTHPARNVPNETAAAAELPPVRR
jgi:hemerythrin superfamily protein